MILTSAIGLIPEYASFLLAGGSDGLADIIAVNVIWQFFFILIFAITILRRDNKVRKFNNVILFFIFFMWILSGRTIALFATGQLNSGWFYFKVNSINICEDDLDCDKVFYYETKVTKLPFWRIRVENKSTDDTIFIGPMLWKEATTFFNLKFPESSSSSISFDEVNSGKGGK
jgi:hypothetical protein